MSAIYLFLFVSPFVQKKFLASTSFYLFSQVACVLRSFVFFIEKFKGSLQSNRFLFTNNFFSDFGYLGVVDLESFYSVVSVKFELKFLLALSEAIQFYITFCLSLEVNVPRPRTHNNNILCYLVSLIFVC